MARARNIKPGFFANEELVELDMATRLLFIGLWTIADREGRLEDRPKRIKMQVFPADDVNVDAALDQLATRGFITRYGIREDRYIQVVNWSKHQSPHVKEAESTIPAPDSESTQGDEAKTETCQAPDEHQTSTVPAPPDSLIPDSHDSGLSDTGENANAAAAQTPTAMPVKTPRPIRPPSGPAQTLVQAWCDEMSVPQPAAYSKAVGQAQQLVNAGITADDAPHLISWLRDQAWIRGAIDLGTMLQNADKWRAANAPRKPRDPNILERGLARAG